MDSTVYCEKISQENPSVSANELKMSQLLAELSEDVDGKVSAQYRENEEQNELLTEEISTGVAQMVAHNKVSVERVRERCECTRCFF